MDPSFWQYCEIQLGIYGFSHNNNNNNKQQQQQQQWIKEYTNRLIFI